MRVMSCPSRRRQRVSNARECQRNADAAQQVDAAAEMRNMLREEARLFMREWFYGRHRDA